MVENELEKSLKEGAITQEEYNYLTQNRKSGLPNYYKSIQFILFLAIVPFLQRIPFILFSRLLIGDSRGSYIIGYLGLQIIFLLIFFLIYKKATKAPLKMAAWVWFIISLASMVSGMFFF